MSMQGTIHVVWAKHSSFKYLDASVHMSTLNGVLSRPDSAMQGLAMLVGDGSQALQPIGTCSRPGEAVPKKDSLGQDSVYDSFQCLLWLPWTNGHRTPGNGS